MRQLLGGVANCHRAFVTHRDLKPSNLIVHIPSHDELLVGGVKCLGCRVEGLGLSHDGLLAGGFPRFRVVLECHVPRMLDAPSFATSFLALIFDLTMSDHGIIITAS